MKNKVLEFFLNNAPVSLTLLSAFGYFCVYVYYYGYFLYFQLPTSFIEVTISDVLFCVFSLACSFIGLIFWFDRISSIDTSYGNHRFFINTVLKTLGFGVVIFFGVLYITPFSIYIYEILFLIIVLFCSGYIFWEYLFIRKKRKWEEEVKHFVKENPSAKVDYVIKELRQKLSLPEKPSSQNSQKKSERPFSELATMILITLLMLLICFGLGYSNAFRTKYFLSFKKHPTIFVMKKYGENLICRNYNFKTKKFGDSILLLRTSDTTNSVFFEERIK